MQLSKAKMSYLGQRQAVLASNIVNVDTPDYRAKDLKAPNFKKMAFGQKLQTTSMTRTHAGHMQPMNGGGSFPIIDRRILDENNPDGNSVNLDTELQNVAFNQAEYDMAVGLYRKNISLIRMAVSNRGG